MLGLLLGSAPRPDFRLSLSVRFKYRLAPELNWELEPGRQRGLGFPHGPDLSRSLSLSPGLDARLGLSLGFGFLLGPDHGPALGSAPVPAPRPARGIRFLLRRRTELGIAPARGVAIELGRLSSRPSLNLSLGLRSGSGSGLGLAPSSGIGWGLSLSAGLTPRLSFSASFGGSERKRGPRFAPALQRRARASASASA